MTGTAEQDPWRLAWMVTCRKLRLLPWPGWGVCMSLVEDAAITAFRTSLQAIGKDRPGTWKQAHDAALDAAQLNLAEQAARRDLGDVKRWHDWSKQ